MDVRPLVIALVLVGAGCLGGGAAGPTTEGTEPASASVTDGSAVANATARADAAEAAYINRTLSNASCVEDGSAGPAFGNPDNDSVINETDGVVYVEVNKPYTYHTGESGRYAHGSTRATYRVTADTVERVEGTDLTDVCADSRLVGAPVDRGDATGAR